jgi:uncharacterized membrane protein
MNRINFTEEQSVMIKELSDQEKRRGFFQGVFYSVLSMIAITVTVKACSELYMAMTNNGTFFSKILALMEVNS